jgi:hypothetical protein
MNERLAEEKRKQESFRITPRENITGMCRSMWEESR